MDLQQVQPVVDGFDQPQLPAHQVHGPDASVVHRPGPVGQVVMNVGRPEHRLLLGRPIPRGEPLLDPPLASFGLPCSISRTHLKCLLA